MTTAVNSGIAEFEVTQSSHRCYFCSCVFHDVASLKAHQKKEHQQREQSYKCKICSQEFEIKTYLRYHMETAHDIQAKHQCGQCKQTFQTKALHIHHRKRCALNEWPCDACDLRFATRTCLSSHKRYMHRAADADVFACAHCQRSFVKKRYRDKHEALRTCVNMVVDIEVDVDGKAVKGEGRKKSERSKANELRYIDITNDGTNGAGDGGGSAAAQAATDAATSRPVKQKVKGYRCEFCGNVYRHTRALHHHRRVKHTEVVRIPCPYPECGFVGPSERRLRDHIRRNHVEGAVFKCEYCPRTFKLRSNMIDHMKRNHTSDRGRYDCTFPGCKKYFVHQYLLDRHIKTGHMKPKGEFQCMKCDKAFHDEPALKQHFSFHQGSQFYFCPRCYAVLRTEKGIRNHMADCTDDSLLPTDPDTTQESQEPHKPPLQKRENLKYEISADQLNPDPEFERVSLQIEAMLMYEGEQKKRFNSEEVDRADEEMAYDITD